MIITFKFMHKVFVNGYLFWRTCETHEWVISAEEAHAHFGGSTQQIGEQIAGGHIATTHMLRTMR